MKYRESFISLTGAVIIALIPQFANADITSSTLPSDSQITEIVETVNHAEIAAGELAKKSSEKKVSQFAEHMISAHSGSDHEITKLEKKMDFSNRNSTWSEKLKIDTSNQLEALKKLRGRNFDREYISAQIKDHSEVLNLFDKTLIPSAKEAGLRTLLAHTRAEVASHLELAKAVQNDLRNY